MVAIFSKFAFTFILAIVAPCILTMHGVKGDFSELARVDCQGVGHLFKNTPFEVDVDLNFFKTTLEGFRNRVAERAAILCPEISDKEINRRLVPSLDMVFGILFGYEERMAEDACDGKFSENLLQLGSYINLVTGGNCYNSFSFPDMTNVFPDTCTPTTWANNGTCFTAVKFSDLMGGFEIDVAAAKCDDSMAWPFFSVNCRGDTCLNAYKPCTDTSPSSNQCGSTLVCTDLGPLISSKTDVESGIAQLFTKAGLWHESIPNAQVWNAVIKPAREFWGSFFSGSSVGEKNDFFKFCLPKAEFEGVKYDTIFDMYPKVLSFEEPEHCYIKPECMGHMNNNTYPGGNDTFHSGRRLDDYNNTGYYYNYTDYNYNNTYNYNDTKGGYCDYPYFDYGCDKNGIRMRQSLNVSRLFKTNDGGPINCYAEQDNTWFQPDCTIPEVPDYNCLAKDMTFIGDASGNFYKCHTLTNGACGFHKIGNGFCDDVCNIEECIFDGGDCQGPAEVISGSGHYDYCDASNHQMLSPSSPCQDKIGSSCYWNMYYYENSGYKQCSYSYQYENNTYTYPINQGCCICNNTSVFETNHINNRNSFYRDFTLTCNTVHPWDGQLASGSVLDLMPMTTLFPVESYKPGETQLGSLDCQGFASMSFVSPLLRAKFTGPLATVKTAEKIVLNVATLRQQSQPQGTFVGADGKFTKLGYMNFGIFTPAFPLWQFTQAIREEPRGTDFKAFEGTTPGTKAMRNWNPSPYTYYGSNQSFVLDVLNIPSSCTFSKYATDGKCLLEYNSPIFPKIGLDMKLKGGISSCPNTHIPEIAVSASSSWFNPFPFMTPCLNDAGCPSSHRCVNLFKHISTIKFTQSGKNFAELEYDLFTFLFFGKSGRDPNWGARTRAWATDDIVYILQHMFGVLKYPNPFTPTPNYGYGEVNLCFPKNDPFLVSLIETGKPYDWGNASQGIQFVSTADQSDSNFFVPMRKITVAGLDATTTNPIGLEEENTLPPTKAPSGPPTKFKGKNGENGEGDSGAGTLMNFVSRATYTFAIVVLSVSLFFMV